VLLVDDAAVPVGPEPGAGVDRACRDMLVMRNRLMRLGVMPGRPSESKSSADRSAPRTTCRTGPRSGTAVIEKGCCRPAQTRMGSPLPAPDNPSERVSSNEAHDLIVSVFGGMSKSGPIAPPPLGRPQRHAAVHERREAVAETGAVEGPPQLADHYRAGAAPGGRASCWSAR
jgi:hypothetical protein